VASFLAPTISENLTTHAEGIVDWAVLRFKLFNSTTLFDGLLSMRGLHLEEIGFDFERHEISWRKKGRGGVPKCLLASSRDGRFHGHERRRRRPLSRLSRTIVAKSSENSWYPTMKNNTMKQPIRTLRHTGKVDQS
jgi:hypothetical protein